MILYDVNCFYGCHFSSRQNGFCAMTWVVVDTIRSICVQKPGKYMVAMWVTRLMNLSGPQPKNTLAILYIYTSIIFRQTAHRMGQLTYHHHQTLVGEGKIFYISVVSCF